MYQDWGDVELDNDVSKLKKAIKEGYDVEKQGYDGYTALIIASKKGYMNIVRYLVEKCKVDVGKLSNIGWSAVAYAIWHSHEIILRYLMKYNPHDSFFFTVLASYKNHESIVRYLVRKYKAKNRSVYRKMVQKVLDCSNSKYIQCTTLNLLKNAGIYKDMNDYVLKCQHKQTIITIFIDRFHLFDPFMLKYIFSFLYPEFENILKYGSVIELDKYVESRSFEDSFLFYFINT